MRFRHLPLARKLIFALMFTAGTALILAAVAFTAYEVYDFRQHAVQKLRALGGVTAANSVGALAFIDPLDAQQTLGALRAERQVMAAALYDSAGRLFATYPADIDRALLPPGPGSAGYQFASRRLESFTPVRQDGSDLGTLFLRLDTSDLNENLMLFLLITGALLAIALIIALILARRMQQLISSPILALSDTARAVSERQDYSVRAARAEQREIQVMNEAFNQMLERIAETQGRLEAQLGRLDLLQRTTRAIGERQDLPSILQVIVGRLESELPVDLACVAKYLPDERVFMVKSVGTRAASLSHRIGMRLREQISIDENGLEPCMGGKVVHEPDLGSVDRPLARRFVREGLSALVVAPLASGNSVWGILIAARRQVGAFSSADVEFLHQLSDHASLAVRQVQLTDDLKKAYEELRQSQLTIAQQERLRALGQMASGIAHDINNAVSPIALYVETLLEREPMLSLRGRGQLEVIQRAIDDVTQTVQRMREFYRRRDVPADAGPVELNALCRAVIDLTRARWADDAQERGAHIELRTEFSHQHVWVRGIDGEIRDALVNLVFNAVDAMPQGGVLTIHTANPKEGDNGLACVAVTDTGVGMDEKTRARCQEPFFTTKGERGTGMGLAMVYGMLQRHKGQIEIESDIGRGTTVRLLLPASSADSAAPRLPAPPIAARRLRLLVVDDDPLLIQSLRDALELDGHQVTVADGGQSGIDAFMTAQAKGERPDAVITDLGMPHLDGRAVAAAVKAVDARTTVILLTGWGARLVAESDVPAGVDRVLSKPPRLPQLREALAAIVPIEEQQ
jgi:signal transduction histidine kinase/ActR/RegA family two-component response regulator/HAMP domain-containing protein